MDTPESGSNLHGTQQPFGQRRRSVAKKKGKQKETDPIARLVNQGWAKKANLSANTVFVCGPMVVKGRLHATDKLCLCGDFVVTNRLECEGTFTLCGVLSCWDKPAIAKNMVIPGHGTIFGDVVVTSGVFVKGKCTIYGKLTVTGIVRIEGTLKCKSLELTGVIKKFGQSSEVIIEGVSVINREDSVSAELLRLFHEQDESNQEQGSSSPE
ncbi:hypothetical protein ONZ43_g3066 [Nemania bipapillata]|uniref:Uncharacterized protein n=1 Tax=Nemania bipapillata TaxID=110536 RepID=A0ACC2IYH6_9PEZI|nr:hypothetical protein ONZ43_g3066 [Nemania bipapillata]